MFVVKSNLFTKVFYLTITLLQINMAHAKTNPPICSGTLTFNGVSMCGTNYIAGKSAFHQCNDSSPITVCAPRSAATCTGTKLTTGPRPSHDRASYPTCVSPYVGNYICDILGKCFQISDSNGCVGTNCSPPKTTEGDGASTSDTVPSTSSSTNGASTSNETFPGSSSNTGSSDSKGSTSSSGAISDPLDKSSDSSDSPGNTRSASDSSGKSSRSSNLSGSTGDSGSGSRSSTSSPSKPSGTDETGSDETGSTVNIYIDPTIVEPTKESTATLSPPNNKSKSRSKSSKQNR